MSKKIGRVIKAELKLQGMTQKELATRIGMEAKKLGRLLNGQRMDVETLTDIEKVLERPPGELLARSN